MGTRSASRDDPPMTSDVVPARNEEENTMIFPTTQVAGLEHPLSVGRWMSKRVYTTRPDSCLIDAFEMMRDNRIRHVPVLDGDKLVGIVSDRDVRSALPSRHALQRGSVSLGDSLLGAKVAHVMSSMPITIGFHTSVREAAELMCRHKIGALPVVDAEKLIGIISAEDILWAIVDGQVEPKRADHG
jgi:acetoin utilization protein AcuB